MLIKEFLGNKKLVAPLEITDGEVFCVQDLYDNYIVKYLKEEEVVTDTIIKWHNLLVAYCERPDAILLSRLYESGSNKGTGGWDNRRGAYTENSFGNKVDRYAFASNNFPRLIFSMAINGYVPEMDDFVKIMRDREISLYSIYGTTTVEKEISAFTAKVYNKAFYYEGMYLAHIIAIGDYPFFNHEEIDINTIFPLGLPEDWKYDEKSQCVIRKNNYVWSNKEREVAVAHFLRFVDPLNYFLIPGVYHADYIRPQDEPKYQMGENSKLIAFMIEKSFERYKEAYENFLDKALVNRNDIKRETLSILGEKELIAKIHKAKTVKKKGEGLEKEIMMLRDLYGENFFSDYGVIVDQELDYVATAENVMDDYDISEDPKYAKVLKMIEKKLNR